MGAVTDEFCVVLIHDMKDTIRIPPGRMFKASALGFGTLLPKIAPQAIQGVELIEGDGGPGSTLRMPFRGGNQVQYGKLKIEAIDEKGFSVNYSLIEGDALMNNLVKISYDIKFIAAPDGGSICKISSSRHYTTGDIYIKEEDVKAEKEWLWGLFKAVEAYLVANRDAYKMKMY